MKTITGTKINNKEFRMDVPTTLPYKTVLYKGYTEEEMKNRYRKDFGLKDAKIEWIILG